MMTGVAKESTETTASSDNLRDTDGLLFTCRDLDRMRAGPDILEVHIARSAAGPVWRAHTSHLSTVIGQRGTPSPRGHAPRAARALLAGYLQDETVAMLFPFDLDRSVRRWYRPFGPAQVARLGFNQPLLVPGLHRPYTSHLFRKRLRW